MMSAKDWISFFVGLLVFALGLLPVLNRFNVGPSWFALSSIPVGILMYVVAAGGFYLAIDSVIEITNSNAIGWISFLIAAVITATGVLKVLGSKGIGPSWFALAFISGMVYNVVFIVLGLFLMVACFAMEM